MTLPFPVAASGFNTTYIVQGADWKKPGVRHNIGYARGDPAVISTYYDDGTYKNIHLEEVEVQNITSDLLEGKQKLRAEKSQLLRRLGELERELLEV